MAAAAAFIKRREKHPKRVLFLLAEKSEKTIDKCLPVLYNYKKFLAEENMCVLTFKETVPNVKTAGALDSSK